MKQIYINQHTNFQIMRIILLLLFLFTTVLSFGQEDIKLAKKGIIQGKKGNYEKAIEYFDQALEINSKSLNALYYKGYSLEQLGRFEEAVDFYTKSLEIEYRGATIYRRGYCYFNSDQDSLAVIDFSEALKLMPDNQEILMMRASAYRRLEKYEELLSDLNTHLEKVPNDFYSKGNKAMTLIELGRYDEGISLLNDLIGERPEEPILYNGIAEAYMRMEKYDDAIIQIDKTISLKEDYDNGHLTKAQILIRQEKIIQACEELRLAEKYGADLSELDDIDKELFKECKE
ncbi:Beta-barrel assembly-enhancing protease [subsurface metagenome]